MKKSTEIQTILTPKLILAVVIVAMSFLYLILLTMFPIPEENKSIITLLTGLLIGTGFGSVITFYFGSSEGSKTKTDIIAGMVNGTKELPDDIQHQAETITDLGGDITDTKNKAKLESLNNG